MTAQHKHLIMASRPKTLGAVIAPVIIGSAMAHVDGGFHWLAAVMALLSAVWIQIGANFANHYNNTIKHGDTNERPDSTNGLPTQPGVIKAASIIAFGLAFLVGGYLVWRGGWPIAIIGLLSIVIGWLYNGGPYPLTDIGVADLFVFLFLGPIAVGGVYYVQTLDINWIIICAGLGPGLLSVATLTAHNLRDYDRDIQRDRRTSATRSGRQYARFQYLMCMAIGCLIPIFLTQSIQERFYAGGTVVLLFFGKEMIKTVFMTTDEPTLNKILTQTRWLALAYGIIFSVGWIWPQ